MGFYFFLDLMKRVTAVISIQTKMDPIDRRSAKPVNAASFPTATAPNIPKTNVTGNHKMQKRA